MTTASAPSQLPFTPKPFRNELFSSWMLRVAAANFVSLSELMLGFQFSYPKVPFPYSLDWDFHSQFPPPMARFCRTSEITLRSLDLRTRLPQAGKAFFLSFRPVSDRCTRLRMKRIGYSFCPTCISEQLSVHVCWEWAFPVLFRCHLHNIPLRHGCPICDEDDPLPFGPDGTTAPVLCWSCGASLTGAIPASHRGQVDAASTLIEKLYRDALRGSSFQATLLGDATSSQFHRFVDDIFQLLCWYPSADPSPGLADPRNRYLSFRTKILATIGALVVNATLGTESNGSTINYREDLALWLPVLSLLSAREAELIETTSELWPALLSRSLNSALDQYERGKPRCSPFRSPFFRPGLKYINGMRFRDLSAANEVET
jgi:hypothetical protein